MEDVVRFSGEVANTIKTRGIANDVLLERNIFMLCPTGQTLLDELKEAGLEVSIAEAERDEMGVVAARGRKREVQRALNDKRIKCDICDNPSTH